MRNAARASYADIRGKANDDDDGELVVLLNYSIY